MSLKFNDEPIQTYPMQSVAPTVARILNIPSPSSAEAGYVEKAVQDLKGVKGVAILAIDAFGYEIFNHFKDYMPCLKSIFEKNPATIKSIMPTITPVNFTCMVTGASQEVHKVTTRFSNIECETLFDVLRKHGMKSAGLGRKDYTGNELLGRYADYSAEGKAESDEEVEKIFIDYLKTKKPEFIIIQYGETDDFFHKYGPYSNEAKEAVIKADLWLSRCIENLRSEGYGIMILADHGQHNNENKNSPLLGAHGRDIDEDLIVPFTWTR
ncbi:MAG TPA: PglZ domain-containing protein [Clostridiaceae bacterium]|nr:PglZ domain-containing protein [Clostridiaceae bacterium]